MTREQANDAVAWMKGLFPTLTLEQGALLSAEFEHYPDSIVTSAIDAHVKRFAYPVIPTLLSSIATLAVACEAAADRQRAQERAEEARLVAQWRQIDQQYHATVAGLSDESVLKLRDEAVGLLAEDMAEDIRPIFCRRHPNSSPVLRAAIVQFMARESK